mgnify:CR=1 FL=1
MRTKNGYKVEYDTDARGRVTDYFFSQRCGKSPKEQAEERVAWLKERNSNPVMSEAVQTLTDITPL